MLYTFYQSLLFTLRILNKKSMLYSMYNIKRNKRDKIYCLQKVSSDEWLCNCDLVKRLSNIQVIDSLNKIKLELCHTSSQKY